jgi:hypothetical protein
MPNRSYSLAKGSFWGVHLKSKLSGGELNVKREHHQMTQRRWLRRAETAQVVIKPLPEADFEALKGEQPNGGVHLQATETPQIGAGGKGISSCRG